MNVLTLTAGKPFDQNIRLPDAKSIWSDLSDLEVRAQLRDGMTTADLLIANLHDYMAPSFDNNDVVIVWHMTGAQTRSLYALNWGTQKRGYFNVIVSDTGTDDAHALVVETIELQAVDTTTTAEDPDE